MKKIVFVIDSLGAGGAEVSTIELAKFLSINNFQVTIVYFKNVKDNLYSRLEGSDVQLKHIQSKGYLKTLLNLYKFIKESKPHIVHSCLFYSNSLQRIVRLFYGNVIAVESLVNTPYDKSREADKRLNAFKFKLVKYADMFLARLKPAFYHAITQEVLNHYKPLFKITDNNFAVIFRGRAENTSVQNRDQLRAQHNVSNKLVLINVGRHEFAKGQLILLGAFQKLHLKYPNVVVWILGKEGNKTKEIKYFIQQHALENKVVVFGFRNDVKDFIAAADVFVFPSLYEGLGGAVIEAMSAKLPVVSSDISVLKEVVGNENDAVFFKSNSESGLLNALEEIIINKNLRSHLADKSYIRFNTAFRIENIHQDFLNLYLKLLKK